MKKSGIVTVVESTELFDFVEIITTDNIYVVSGELVEKDGNRYLLKLTNNSAIRVNKRVFFWWNREKKCFVRQ